MRRFTTASMALTLAATTAFAGAAAVMAQDGADLKIGVVTDVGTIDDRNFNQYSWEGAVAGAEAVGAAEPQYAISQQSVDIAPNIQAFVDQEYDVIVTVGFAAGGDTIAAAKANPDIKFIGVDQSPCITLEGDPDASFACEGNPAELLPNLQGLNWREQQPGYLAGIIAADVSETGHVAAIGGTAVVPAVPNYIEGFAEGVLSVNPDAVVTVTYASGAPDAAAFNDPAGGQALAQQLLARGSRDRRHVPGRRQDRQRRAPGRLRRGHLGCRRGCGPVPLHPRDRGLHDHQRREEALQLGQLRDPEDRGRRGHGRGALPRHQHRRRRHQPVPRSC